MGTALKSASVAFLAAAEGTEQSELQHPWDAVIAQGGHPVLVSPAPDKIQMFEHLDRGDTMPVDVQAGTALVADFAGLVLPGGVIFTNTQSIMASICRKSRLVGRSQRGPQTNRIKSQGWLH